MILKRMALVLVVDEVAGAELFNSLEGASLDEIPNGEVAFKGIEIDTSAHRAYVDGLELKLTAIEFDLLLLLVAKQGHLVTFEEALESVWNDFYHVSKKQVSNCVSRLNEKLGRGRIENVRGCGYRLT